MNLEIELYHIALVVAGAVNLLITVTLLHNNIWYRNYEVYHRSRTLTAINYFVFGIGFLMHYYFQWRSTWPEAATALSVSYFHIGGVLFSWSHIPLMRPDYLTVRTITRDLIILAIGISAYWATVAYSPLFSMNAVIFIFFAHACFLAFTFYRTYFQLRRNLISLPIDSKAPDWWTPETKRAVINNHHSFIIGCHLIILFGLGSIVFTALLPTSIWPYSLLLVAGMAVFVYIFYSLSEYGVIIESATCATEDAIISRDKQQTV